MVRDQAYGLPADMWSAGVSLYIMLSSYEPFAADSQAEVFAMITSGVIEFNPTEEWQTVGGDAKDLVRALLTVDAHARLTVEDALAHPWFS